MKKRRIKNKRLRQIVRKLTHWYYYCAGNVWKDQRSVWYVNLIKTINLSVTSYLDKNIQSKASSLTYNTLLAIVPALALMFAIAKGFGLQNLIKTQLHSILPSQVLMIDTSLKFVDKYLATASGGVFVGVGIVFLLWTLISLLRNIEVTFNYVWGVKKGRSAYRMITDYTTIIIILPVLLICSSGISIFMSSFVQDNFQAEVSLLSPFVTFLLDLAPWVLTSLFFAGMNMLIPYTKVKAKYALISGFICGVLFQVLQYVFVSGQIYVSKYNAIYGSFSFLPLFLIWMYMTWLICIGGVVLTYASQNVFRFNYSSSIAHISRSYMDELTVYLVLVIVKRFEEGKSPLTKTQIMEYYDLPIRLVNMIVNKLVDAGMLSMVTNDDDSHSYQPAINFSRMSLNEFLRRYDNIGYSNFISELRRNEALLDIRKWMKQNSEGRNMRLSELIKQTKI